jgi:hypothetical protein
MISGFHDVKIESWNTQGLGCLKKRPRVRDAISSAAHSIMCIEDTKLSAIDIFVFNSFLPNQLSCFDTVDAVGSSGGILAAWDPALFSLVATHRDRFSLTTTLQSYLSDLVFAITNVYTPSDHSLTPAFLSEFESLRPLFPFPRLVVGDFNLVRDPSDKNNGIFNPALANSFNEEIKNLALFELPLLDRLYTWSNKHASPS